MQSLFDINDLFVKLLSYCELEEIETLYGIDDYFKLRINCNLINLEFMPIFRECNDFMLYKQHHQSFISGTNFPEEPLWIFDYENDCSFKLEDNKYNKIKCNKYNRDIGHPHKIPEFKGGLYHWKLLNDEQKLLIWDSIHVKSPDNMTKEHRSDDIVTLLHEMFWHYSYSYVRQYLEIYMMDDCSLNFALGVADAAMDRDIKLGESIEIKSQQSENPETKKMFNMMNSMFSNFPDDKIKNIPKMQNVLMKAANMVSKITRNVGTLDIGTMIQQIQQISEELAVNNVLNDQVNNNQVIDDQVNNVLNDDQVRNVLNNQVNNVLNNDQVHNVLNILNNDQANNALNDQMNNTLNDQVHNVLNILNNGGINNALNDDRMNNALNDQVNDVLNDDRINNALGDHQVNNEMNNLLNNALGGNGCIQQ